MNILLIGEYSGVHNNLKLGLTSIGHTVTIWAGGDGWKKFPSDISTNSRNKIRRLFSIFVVLIKLGSFDVIQAISPVDFPVKLNINKIVYSALMKKTRKFFLVGAGASATESVLYDYLSSNYKYPDFFKAISKEHSLWSNSKTGRKYNTWLFNRINGFIPIMYEYAEPYRLIEYPRLCKTIPMPLDYRHITYSANNVGDKVVFFHGINRIGEKGTNLIIPAMERLRDMYPDEVEIIIGNRIPIDQYLPFLETVNVVIDQAYSVSYGMNVLYAMAKGRVVVGGGEEECLQEFGLTECPIVPINPDVDDIYNKLVMVLERKDEILEWGRRSREFVETHHDAVKIATQYLEVWENA